MTTTDFSALHPMASLATQAWKMAAAGVAQIDTDNIINHGAQLAIKNMTPEQALDFLAKQSPESQNLIDAVRTDPKLTNALHNAMANDATVVAGFRKLGDAEGGSLNADSLANAIKDPAMGGSVRNAMTQVLNVVGKDGDGGFGFDYLVEVGQNATNYMEDPKDTGKFNLLRDSLKKGNIVSPEVEQAGFFHDLWNNPRGALTNLVDSLSFLPDSIKNVLVGLGELVSNFISGVWNAGPMAFYNDPAAQRLGNKLLDLGADVRREEARPASFAETAEEFNRPGAMQGSATGAEPPVSGIGEGPNPNGGAASAQRDAAAPSGPDAPEQRFIPTPRPAMGLGMGAN